MRVARAIGVFWPAGDWQLAQPVAEGRQPLALNDALDPATTEAFRLGRDCYAASSLDDVVGDDFVYESTYSGVQVLAEVRSARHDHWPCAIRFTLKLVELQGRRVSLADRLHCPTVLLDKIPVPPQSTDRAGYRLLCWRPGCLRRPSPVRRWLPPTMMLARPPPSSQSTAASDNEAAASDSEAASEADKPEDVADDAEEPADDPGKSSKSSRLLSRSNYYARCSVDPAESAC